MHRLLHRPLILASLLTAAAAVVATAAPWPKELSPPALKETQLPPDRFSALHQAVQPGTEAWLEIGWETDLPTARRRAAEENKPIYMWVMDGHPLGCT